MVTQEQSLLVAVVGGEEVARIEVSMAAVLQQRPTQLRSESLAVQLL